MYRIRGRGRDEGGQRWWGGVDDGSGANLSASRTGTRAAGIGGGRRALGEGGGGGYISQIRGAPLTPRKQGKPIDMAAINLVRYDPGGNPA